MTSHATTPSTALHILLYCTTCRVLYVMIVFSPCSPYHLVMYVVWYLQWVWRYDMKGEDLREEDKIYLIRKKLKLSETHWRV